MSFGLKSFDLEALDRLRAERLEAGVHRSLLRAEVTGKFSMVFTPAFIRTIN